MIDNNTGVCVRVVKGESKITFYRKAGKKVETIETKDAISLGRHHISRGRGGDANKCGGELFTTGAYTICAKCAAEVDPR